MWKYFLNEVIVLSNLFLTEFFSLIIIFSFIWSDFTFLSVKQMQIKLCSFFNRHTFTVSSSKKQEIWRTVEKLLVDNQIEASS